MECCKTVISELSKDFEPEYEYVDKTDFISRVKKSLGFKVEKQKALKFEYMKTALFQKLPQTPISYHVKCSESGEITSTPIVKYRAKHGIR